MNQEENELGNVVNEENTQNSNTDETIQTNVAEPSADQPLMTDDQGTESEKHIIARQHLKKEDMDVDPKDEGHWETDKGTHESPEVRRPEDETYEESETSQEEEEEIDYASMSQEQLLDFVRDLSTESDQLVSSNRKARDAKPFFTEFVNQQKEEALQKFLADGGDKDAFQFKQDETTEEFYKICNDIREKKSIRDKQHEETQDNNLKKKEALIDRLRIVISDSETKDSFTTVKAIQEEWKSIGPIPKAQLESTWASYSALLDIYYNNRSIHYELKELDRKKNLDEKLELCVQAENLYDLEDIRTAVAELNTLHEKFKQIGPIPKEEQEPVWQRFKAASDKIYDKRRAFSEEFKKELQANLLIKKEICERVKAFENYDTDRIKEWNEETKKLLALQKEWEAVGPVPRENSKEVAKQFWASFKVFFKHKSEFFAKLDEAREDNFVQKEAILKEAQALIETENDDNKEAISKKLKEFQATWKTVGPVPEKKKDQVIPVFRKLLDSFFDRRRKKFAEKDLKYKENLDSKRALCEEIVSLSEGDLAGISHTDILEGFVKRWKEIGFVPIKQKDKILEQFNQAVETYVSKIPDLEDKQKEVLQIEVELKLMGAGGGSRSLERKEEGIRKKIRSLEDELDTLNNNLGFFSKSKTANQMLSGFEVKAEKLKKQIAELRKQLKTFRKLRNKTKAKTEDKNSK